MLVLDNLIEEETNTLFPVFLKLNQMSILLIGGGNVALEKLHAILCNSPTCKVTVVALKFIPELVEFVMRYSNVVLINTSFNESHLFNNQIVVSAVNDDLEAFEIKRIVSEKGVLFNSADKPELCDFYLGSIVTKGHLKIGISTNGKSPTMAKRIKEIMNETIPDSTNQVIENLHSIRNDLKGDFDFKVKTLNQLTTAYITPEKKTTADKLKNLFKALGLVVLGIVIGQIVFNYFEINLNDIVNGVGQELDAHLGWYLLIGFVAQFIDGTLGMAYGVSVTTLLMSLGIPFITPVVASASMHASEVFTTGTSSLIYMKNKQVNRKMFKALLIPGVIGAVIGVCALNVISKESLLFLRPLIGCYTLILGLLIIKRAYSSKQKTKRKLQLKPIAFSGGFLDSVGGGGWGPIVTSSLIAGGRQLKYAVGTAHLTKFFVALTSTIMFFSFIGFMHWKVIVGLVLGGVIASPISIYFSNKIPVKKGMVLVGVLIIVLSLKSIIQYFMGL